MPYQSDLEEKFESLFQSNKTLLDYLNWFSVYVWENLRFSAESQKDFIPKVGETELTNYLVRDLARTLKEGKIALPIRLFHAKDEKTNGQDIEIVIQIDKDKYVLLACQAKILYVDKVKNNLIAKYSALGHEVGEKKTPQINLLTEYAKKEKCFPVYLLYNYTEYKIPTVSEIYLYGCSLLNAIYLKEKCTFFELSKQTFQDLHPPASPFQDLTKIKDLDSLKTLFGEATMDYSIKTYTLKELLLKGKWVEIAPSLSESIKRFTGANDLEKIILTQKEAQNTFNPTFRIIITQDNLIR